MVTCALVGLPSEPPRVAYAVGRRAGGAVTRNRIRRRLRAATQAHAAELEPGRAYLIGVVRTADSVPYATLSDALHAALRALRKDPS